MNNEHATQSLKQPCHFQTWSNGQSSLICAHMKYNLNSFFGKIINVKKKNRSGCSWDAFEPISEKKHLFLRRDYIGLQYIGQPWQYEWVEPISKLKSSGRKITLWTILIVSLPQNPFSPDHHHPSDHSSIELGCWNEREGRPGPSDPFLYSQTLLIRRHFTTQLLQSTGL